MSGIFSTFAEITDDMKKFIITFFVASFVGGGEIMAQEKVIENPVYENGSITFYTTKVILNNDKTTLGINFKMQGTAGTTWHLAKNSHLASGGKDYAMKSCTVFSRDEEGKVLQSESLDYDKAYTLDWDSLSIDFEPLDKGCKIFDFIETPTSNFNHYGIRLDGKKYDYLFKDKVKPLYGKNEPLPPITPQYGKSTVKYDIPRRDGGKYDTGIFSIKNDITGEYYPYDPTKPNQMTIEASNVYMITNYEGVAIPVIPFGHNQFSQMMIPGTETTITFDAAACTAFAKSKGKAKIPFDKCVRFSGSIGDLQEVLMRERDFGYFLIKDQGIGADSLWNRLQENIRKINGKEYKDKKYSRRQKEFLQLWLEYNYVKHFLDPGVNPNGGLVDKHSDELGILFKDGRSFYLVGNDDYLDYLDYAHANGIKGEVTEWLEGYHRAMNLANHMCSLEIMPEEAYDTIPEYFHKELHQLADSTLATIERLKNMAGEVTVKETPNVDASEFLKTVLEENKGNVVFFDFWATWCGPCKRGIKAMEAKKEEFLGKPVKFIYVTNESSPINEWTKTVQSMPGTHYRLKNAMWYNIKEIGDAIPRYLMFDKDGKQIYEQTGFDDEVLEEMLKHIRENL